MHPDPEQTTLSGGDWIVTSRPNPSFRVSREPAAAAPGVFSAGDGEVLTHPVIPIIMQNTNSIAAMGRDLFIHFLFFITLFQYNDLFFILKMKEDKKNAK
jgi:hypothetical protein